MPVPLSHIPAFRHRRRSAWKRVICWVAITLAGVVGHGIWAGHRWAAYREAALSRGVMLDLPASPAKPIPASENFAYPGGPFASLQAADGEDPETERWLVDFKGLPFMFPSFSKGERMTTEMAYAKVENLEGRNVRAAGSMAPPPTLSPIPAPFPRTAEGFFAQFAQNFGAEWPVILDAEARPKTQYDAVPARGPSQNRYNLSGLIVRKAAQVHSMRAVAFLDLGRSEEALAEIRSGFGLVHGIERGGDANIIPYMIQSAISYLMLESLWEGLSDGRWSESDLRVLGDEVAALHPAAGWASMIDGERAWENSAFDGLGSFSASRRTATLRFLFGQPASSPAAGWAWLCGCSNGLIRENQLAANEWADAARGQISADGQWHRESAPEHDFEHLGEVEGWHYAIARRLISYTTRAACRIVVVEGRVRQARVAIALERYRQQHMQLPDRLDALVPEFISAIPRDPLDGQAIRYAREAGGAYRLWCVGEVPGEADFKPYEVEGGPSDENGKRLSTDLIWHGLAPNPDEVKETATR